MRLGRLLAFVTGLLLAVALVDSSDGVAEGKTYRVTGLKKKAEILVDSAGVPHIFARQHYDAFFVQGFNAARDRLWQIDLFRKRGLGLLSRDLGPAYVERDRANRLLNYRGSMRREWRAYGYDARRISRAFTAGINAYVDLALDNEELLPWEFKFLNYRPDHWKPADVVRLRTHGLVGNLTDEVARAYFMRDHGLGYEDIRFPLQPDWDIMVPEGLDLSALPEDQDDLLRVYDLAVSGVPFGPEELRGFAPGKTSIAGRRVRRARASPRKARTSSADRHDAEGSNNWAVSPSRTTVAGPLFASDPHRTQAVPSLRYAAHLRAPGIDVIGAGEPGLPGISLGHNRHITFGLTVFAIDQEDLFVYETSPRHPNRYRYRGRWKPMRVETERIRVRGGEPVATKLKFTRHGPVIYEDPQRHLAFAVRTVFSEPGTAPYFASIGYMRARNWRQFLRAMDRWGLPGENLLYSDKQGNIGWKPGGLTPSRENWDGLLPVPGEGRHEWRGFHDADELPVSFNPARGWEATANEMRLFDQHETGPLPEYVQRKISFEWSNPWRADRLREVLAQDDDVTLEEMRALQLDNLSIPARRVLTALGDLRSDSPAVSRALDLLKRWNFHMDNDSPAAALFEQWTGLHGEAPNSFGAGLLAEAVDDPEVVEAIGEPAELAFVDMVEHPEDWFDGGAATRDRVALATLEAAIDRLTQDQGADMESWRFGVYNKQELIHPLSALVDPGTRAKIDIEAAERRPTPNVVGNSGASWRFIAEPGNWDRAVAMSNPGQSGDPESPFYENLFDPWRRGDSFPLRFSRATVRDAAVEKIRLVPAN